MTSGPLPAAAEVIEVAPLPLGRRAVSLADVSEPIPLTWIIRSGVVIGLVIVGAIVLAIAAHCGGSESTSSSPSPPKSAAAPPPAIPALVAKPPVAPPSTKPPAASPPATDPDAKPPGTEPSQSPSSPSSSPSAPPPSSVATAKPPAANPKPTTGTAKPAAGTAKAPERDAQLKALLHELEAGKTCAERKQSISKLVELHDARALAPLKAAHARVNVNNTCLKADAEHAIKELGGTLK